MNAIATVSQVSTLVSSEVFWQNRNYYIGFETTYIDEHGDEQWAVILSVTPAVQGFNMTLNACTSESSSPITLQSCFADTKIEIR